MFRRFARKTFGNTDFEQIKGVLAHADCQNILEHRGTQRVAQRNTEKEGATRPREQRTENGEQRAPLRGDGRDRCAKRR